MLPEVVSGNLQRHTFVNILAGPLTPNTETSSPR